MADIELFKLFGTILIDNDPANRKLEETDSKAQKVGRTLGSMITTAAKWGAGIAAGATAAGGALLALASRAARSADALNVNAQRAGTTTTAFQEMRYALTQVGVAESDVSMSLQRLNQRVGEAEEGSSKYAQALQRLGVSTRDVNGEIKSSDALFMELVTRLNQVEDAQLRAALGGQIFGVNLAQRLLPAIEAGGDALADLRNRAHAVGAVMDEEAVSAGSRFAGALDELRSVAGNVFNQFAIRLVPIFERFVAFAVENLPKIGPVMEFIGEVVEIVIRHTRRALEPWIALIMSILGVGWDWTVNIVGTAWEWLTTTTWAEKWQDIKGWLTDGWNWTINILGKAWDWLTETSWTEKIDDIRGWLSSAWNWTVNLAGKLWDWLDEKAPWATETIRTIRDWLLAAWDWAVNLVGEFWDWLDEKAPWLTSFLETVWDWFQKGWTWALNFVGDAWDWLRETAWPWLQGAAATTWDWTLNLLGAFASWIKDTAWPWLSKTASTVWNWSLAVAGEFFDWLRDVAWPWLSQAASTAWDWTVNLLGDAIRWVKDTAWPIITAGAASAWGFTLNLLGDAWTWLRDVAWPVLSQGAASAWDWTLDAAGAAWEWLTEGGWRNTLESIQEGFAGLPGVITGYVSETVESVRHWFGARLDAVVGLVINTVIRIANFFQALKDGLIRRTTDMVSGVLQWFIDLKDRGLKSVQALAEGIQEWWGETKLGKTFAWLNEQIAKVGDWFFDLYDRVVGHSYVPDMVEEIGQAIERLRDKLANPVVRYTAQALEAFEDLEDGAAESMMRMAEAMDEALKRIGNQISRWIGDTTRVFWNGTASWTGILDSFAGAIGGIFGTVFDGITKELVANILAQNQWLVATLANIATSVTAFLGQAYAALVGFFWFLGPGAPVAAAGVIAAAIAGIAAIGGQIVRGILPDPPSGSAGGDIGGGGGAGDTGPRVGRQVSEITGPTRDLLTDLLTPLVSLNTLTGIGERIYNLLNERLPMPGMQLASVGAVGVGGFHITIEREAVQVIRTGGGDTDIDDDTIDEIAERLAEQIAFKLRGAGQNG